MIETDFTRLVGCRAPLQVAPMPGLVTVELAAAVSQAGALPLLPTPMSTPEGMRAQLETLSASAPGPFGAGFLMPFLDPAVLEIAAERVRVVDFFYGAPDPALVRRVHAGGALAAWQVGSADEARAAEGAGCDVVVAQGTEAGGHVRGRTSLLPLLDEVLDAVSVPVVAAGGLATARDLAAVLAAGASGARMGTRFLAAAETATHPRYLEALLAARAEDTVLTEVFSVMWPDAPHRVLRSALEAVRDAGEGELLGETRDMGQMVPVVARSVIPPNRETTGRIEAMCLYAGESVGQVTRVQPAREIVEELVDGAARLLAAGR